MILIVFLAETNQDCLGVSGDAPAPKTAGYVPDPALWQDWRKLQTSDHFYYMCTKWLEDGDVHKYFNPYASPYDAYINYMNVLDDFSGRLPTGGGEITA